MRDNRSLIGMISLYAPFNNILIWVWFVGIIMGSVIRVNADHGPVHAINRYGQLTQEDRVCAHTALERFYYEQRTWPAENPEPKPAFETMISPETIRQKLLVDLKKELFLETYWGEIITGEHVQAEIVRIEKNTKAPEKLQALYRVLDNDPFLIAECLARPLLVDRLVRKWYARDERFHGQLRDEVLGIYEGTVARELESIGPGSLHSVYLSAAEEAPIVSEKGSARVLSVAEYDEIVGTYPLDSDSLRFSETDDAFVLKRTDLRTATVFQGTARIFSKIALDEWLECVDISNFDFIQADPPAGGYQIGKKLEGGLTPDSWATEPYLPPRGSGYKAVWTGNEMIVWGGETIGNIGGKYDPLTDTWTRTSEVGAPEWAGTAVWTGSEMVVWGGYSGSSLAFNSGGRYNPQSDTWSSTSTGTNCPSARYNHTAVWNGYYMIIWGGVDSDITLINTGGRYNPGSDSWAALATTGAPEPRRRHTAVYVGWEMIVWGGDNWGLPFNSGGRYNPAANTWTSTCSDSAAPCNVPTARLNHTAVSTGNRMIIWGGEDCGNTGAMYNSDTDTWTATATGANCPSARYDHSAVWTGQMMAIWGGKDDVSGEDLNNGRRYRPDTNSWSTISTTNAPQARSNHIVLWTGSDMIVWGGSKLDSGGRYCISSNSWTPIAAPAGPGQRSGHSVVWTGSEMIVWGGNLEEETGSGSRYFPVTDTWLPIGTGGDCPSARYDHTAVWTGSEMIIWGGFDIPQGIAECNTGGRYDPVLDDGGLDPWQATSTGTNCPSERRDCSMVWTGTYVTIWGGADYESSGGSTTYFNTGGRYLPGSDSWLSTNTATNCPPGRSNHSTVWTGQQMIFWGGYSGTVPYHNDGARYYPATNTWGTVSLTDAPEGRGNATAVWNKDLNEMIVWGGTYYDTGTESLLNLNTGGCFNPALNIWSMLSTSSTPEARANHTAVWTGDEMIVWGGSRLSDDIWGMSSGGRYRPDEIGGSWTSTPLEDVPPERRDHTAIWTGTEMIVWGGTPFGGLGILYPSTAPLAVPVSDLSAVLLLHLDEPPGRSTFADGSGLGNDGSCTGCPLSGSSGQVRLAATYDGDKDDIVISSTTSLNTASEITLMAWIKPATGATSQPILEFGDISTTGVHLWQYDAFDYLYVDFVDDDLFSHPLSSPAGQFTPEVWYHVAASYGENTGRLYVNGFEVASQDLGNFTLATKLDFHVGSRILSTDRHWFAGSIDEVAVFKRALTPLEVRDRYIRDAAVLYLHLDDPGSLMIYQDSSAWGNHPTCAIDTCPTILEQGWVNSARSFDGVDDYLVVKHRPEIDFDETESFSVQAWIRTDVGSTGLNAPIVSKRPGSGYTPNHYSLELRENAYGGMSLYAEGTGYVVVQGETDLRDGLWHHIVGVLDRSIDLALIYIDGDLVDSGTFTGPVSNIADVMVGRGWRGSVMEYFKGDIDEVIIFNRALDANEVQSLYNTPPASPLFVLGQTDTISLDGVASTVGSNPHSTTPDDDAYDTRSNFWDLHDAANCCGTFDIEAASVRLDESDLISYGLATPGLHRIWLKSIDTTDRIDCVPLVFKVLDGAPPEIEIITPNGGDSWTYSESEQALSSHLISWEASDNFVLSRNRLIYSTDEGETWTCIADSEDPIECPADNASGTDTLEADDHSFWWDMPTADQANAQGQTFPSARCRIRLEVTDNSANSATDESNANFYIIKPTTSAVKTLVLWDSGRIESQYGTAAQEALALKLQELSEHNKIVGIVRDLVLVSTIQQAYYCWDSCYPGPCSTELPCDESGAQERANSVAAAIWAYLYNESDGLITTTYTNVRYIILVGDDQQIPFYRMPDGTSIYPESQYPDQVGLDTGSTVGSAIALNYFLTDNYYAESGPELSDLPGDGSVYLNDLAIGRLVETPDQMIELMNIYLSHDGQVNLTAITDRVLVTGFDFLYDSACVLYQEFLGQETTDFLLDDPEDLGLVCPDLTYSDSDLGNQLFSTSPPQLALVNTHANHYGWAASDLSLLTAVEMNAPPYDAYNLNGTIVYSSGCHSGLPVPLSDPNPLDLPEVLSTKGVLAYIGNTGYGWGIKHGRGLTEKLIEKISGEILTVDSLSIGNALAEAKRDYYLETNRYDVFDEKVLHELTLFGIPNTVIVTDVAKRDDEKPGLPAPDGQDYGCADGVCLTKKLHSSSTNKDLPSGVTELELNFSFGSGTYTKINTEDGDYYELNGRSSDEVGDALQPQFVYESQLSGTEAHGVVFTGGHYSPEEAFNPVIGVPRSTNPPGDEGPLPLVSGFTPCVRVSYGTSGGSAQKDIGQVGYTNMVVRTGYFEETENTEAHFNDMQMVVYYSTSSDIISPTIADPGVAGFHVLDGLTASFSVPVSDDSGVYRVVITYNDYLTTHWKTMDLTNSSGTWQGNLTLMGDIRYFVQAIDNVGNVGLLSSSGPDLSGGTPVPYGSTWEGPITYEITLADSDEDGLPDLFEDQHDCLDSAVADAEADPDYDLLNNLAECVLGSDPCRGDTDGGRDNDGSEYNNNRTFDDRTDDLHLTMHLTKAGTVYTLDWNDTLGNNSLIDGYYFVYRSESPFFEAADLISAPIEDGLTNFADDQSGTPPCTNCYYKVWNYQLPDTPPKVLIVSPSSGPQNTGTPVTVLGHHFQPNARVLFCSTPASDISVTNENSISCTTPPLTAGSCPVSVINPDNQIGTLSGGYTYLP
ncbi:IPT/TIG domain-containing protein [bacterium]|nr:IPT/TIG domain-containing protein [bacterium]